MDCLRALIDILNHPNVNYKRTITNDIYEMYEIFGIEAARLAGVPKEVIQKARKILM